MTNRMYYRTRRQKLSELLHAIFIGKPKTQDSSKSKILILSNYRSGSTFLQSALSTARGSLNMDEPFGKVGQKEVLKRLATPLIRKARLLEGISNKYLKEGHTPITASVLMTHLDVELEKFLDFLLKRGWCVIGITRDPVDIVISLFTAIRTGKWHNTQRESPILKASPIQLKLGLSDDIEGTKRLVAQIHENNYKIKEASNHYGFPVLDYQNCLKDTQNHRHAQKIIQRYYPNITTDFINSSIKRNPKHEIAFEDAKAVHELRAFLVQLKLNAKP